jgi:hypothetical protein
MENTYWNKSGKYQADYDRLVDAMPWSGNCETTAGEMIRAASKLGYDFYNNGMGNNTSGAVNFLDKMGVFDYDRTNIFGKIYEYTRGKIYNGNYKGDDLHLAIEQMIDLTLEMIRKNPSLETQENTYDMLDFTDPEERFYDEEEEDYYV